MIRAVQEAEARSFQQLPSTKVVYLFGAGASQAAVASMGSSVGILMKDLTQEINEEIHKLVTCEYRDEKKVLRFVNEVVCAETDVNGAEIDIEHIITFLEESASQTYRGLARQLRKVFRAVLQKRLSRVKEELNMASAKLYATLIDLHLIPNFTEELSGIITLNYDGLLESAICELHEMSVDFGVRIANPFRSQRPPLKVLKLHGSFDWTDEWPIGQKVNLVHGCEPLWIPPGIQKSKDIYPFSVLWGMARELLECDILRIVGCNLSANDWNLVSMLFTTKHAHSHRKPYEIEIIDAPNRANEIKERFPYLEPKSLIELGDGIGTRFMDEALDSGPRQYRSLSDREKQQARAAVSKVGNPFHRWLKHKAEILYLNLESIKTEKGFIENFATSR